EMPRDPRVIELDVPTRWRVPEQLVEVLVALQMASGGDLHAAERDVRRVEIDRSDVHRRLGQIGKAVAAARGDGDAMLTCGQRHRLHIDDRVLPDLRIDETGKGEREGTFRYAGTRQRAMTVHGLSDERHAALARDLDRLCDIR